MESPTALTQSMHKITATKLTALSEQQRCYEREKNCIIKAVSEKQHTFDRVQVLLDAFKEHNIAVPSSISANIQRLLERSRYDPKASAALLQKSQSALEQALDVPSRKYEHASLFGQLVTEWLGSRNGSSTNGSAGSDASDPFEHIGRKEMHDQRREWESIVFAEGSKSDPKKVEAYLANVFGSTSMAKKMIKTPLESLRRTMESFKLETLDTASLMVCIDGVIKTEMLSEEKRTTMAEFRNNNKLLQEMVDVLNMQIDGIDSWSWGDDAVPVEVRRALNGKYRVYMNEEMLQALFLHYVGLKWATHLKMAFLGFFQSGAWKQASRSSLNKQARQRRHDFLGRVSREHLSVRNERREKYQKEYFMLQLPSSFETLSDNYDEMDDWEGEFQTEKGFQTKSPMAMKQSLLHLITTEALVNTKVYGSFTILQSDFRWFGPSMPHATIMAVLRFFGVSDQWLKFFEKFLKAPVKFVQDGPGAQAQVRQSGVPIAHRLSDALGEAVLFCLDFAVNKVTESNLYRLHDDIWFWGARTATVTAWNTIQDFAKVMGLELNDRKTGAMELSGEPVSARQFSPSESLPSGPITWGFLRIGPSGKWIINDDQVETHVAELRLQLQSCTSILAWVQAWNIYVGRFIPNNFGEQANCLGRPHLDMVNEAFVKMQQRLFATEDMGGDNVIAHLRAKLADRFGAKEIPDGFFYFPVKLGGLDLTDPLILLSLLHEYSTPNPMNTIDEAFELEEEDYAKAKKAFLDGSLHSRFSQSTPDHDIFIDFNEYVKYREETSGYLLEAYKSLLDRPRQSVVLKSAEISNACAKLPHGLVARGDSYNDEVLESYGAAVIEKYGGLAMGEKRLLPIGLVSMLRSEKVKWQG